MSRNVLVLNMLWKVCVQHYYIIVSSRIFSSLDPYKFYNIIVWLFEKLSSQIQIQFLVEVSLQCKFSIYETDQLNRKLKQGNSIHWSKYCSNLLIQTTLFWRSVAIISGLWVAVHLHAVTIWQTREGHSFKVVNFIISKQLCNIGYIWRSEKYKVIA